MIKNKKDISLESRFREIGAGSVRFLATREEVLEFIRKEKMFSFQEGYKAGLIDTKSDVEKIFNEIFNTRDGASIRGVMTMFVTIEKIKRMAKEWGVNL